MQLTDYGISGIPVFQLSRYAVRALDEGCSVVASMDFLPDFEKESLHGYLEWRMEQCPYKTMQQSLIGLVPDRLIPLVAPPESDIFCVTKFLKDFPVIIRGAASMEQAQVCSGGVRTEELTEHMESRLVSGLYFAGEAADVDGACGGYNLQWAWSSGAAAGSRAAQENSGAATPEHSRKQTTGAHYDSDHTAEASVEHTNEELVRRIAAELGIHPSELKSCRLSDVP